LTTAFDITEPKTPEDIKELIEQRIPSIDKDALECIIEHKIDGVTFLELTEEYLRELFPLLGDRIKVKRLINELCTSIPPQAVDSFAVSSPLIPTSNKRKRMVLSSDEEQEEEVLVDTNLITSNCSSPACSSRSHVSESPTASLSSVNSASTIKTAKVKAISDWTGSFTVPTRFSTSTSNAIKCNTLTSKSRDEIVNAMSTCMLIHTLTPTPDDISVCCKKMISKHPTLKDTNGSGYVSCFENYTNVFYIRILGNKNY
jgi:hypothetical protein